MIRESRKVQHIEHFLATAGVKANNGFGDVHLVPDALSNYSLADVSLRTKLAGIQMANPLFINAITGGDDKVLDLNRRLAACAKKTGLAMAVGSQYAAIKNPEVRSSYEIVRKENPDGVIFGNIGAYATVEQAREAVKMLDAQALQIHLNIAQELFMQEGDRDFTNYLDNIKAIAAGVDVPVIVKETGCGISYETARQLASAGIRVIDVSGAGGTSFIAIESSRTGVQVDESMYGWGINTAISTYEAVRAVGWSYDVIASGGIATGLQAVKAFVLGARAVGIAGAFLKTLLENDEQALCQQIEALLLEIKKCLLLAGCSSIEEANRKRPVFTGFAKEWLESRGFNLASEKRL